MLADLKNCLKAARSRNQGAFVKCIKIWLCEYAELRRLLLDPLELPLPEEDNLLILLSELSSPEEPSSQDDRPIQFEELLFPKWRPKKSRLLLSSLQSSSDPSQEESALLERPLQEPSLSSSSSSPDNALLFGFAPASSLLPLNRTTLIVTLYIFTS